MVALTITTPLLHRARGCTARLGRLRRAKCAYAADERYACRRFVKVPTDALYDRDLPEGALMVFALIGKHSIIRNHSGWLRDWCSLSPREIARQLNVSHALVRAALESGYVESGPEGSRIRQIRGNERFAPLPFGPLGGPDDAPAMTAREYLLLALGLHRELAGVSPLDSVQLAAVTRTSSGRAVSPSAVAASLKSLAERGWVASEMVVPMRSKRTAVLCDSSPAAPISSAIFSAPPAENIPASSQVGAMIVAQEPPPLRQSQKKPSSFCAPSSPSVPSSRAAHFDHAVGATYVPRAKAQSHRGSMTTDRKDVAAVRAVLLPVIGKQIIEFGLGRAADGMIAREIDRGTSLDRLLFRTGAAVMKLRAGELYLSPGPEGAGSFLRFVLARPQGCADLGCEDGLLWDYGRKMPGDACAACRERRMFLTDAKRGAGSAAEGPGDPFRGDCPPPPFQGLSEAPRASGPRKRCRECEIPFADGKGPVGGVCRDCR